MSFINENTFEYPVSEQAIKSLYPTISWAQPFVPPAPFRLVETTPPPEYDPEAQRVVEGDPELVEGVWRKAWVVEEIPPLPEPVPDQVSQRQARLVLLRHGLLEQIPGVIAAIEDPVDRQAAEIEWEYASFIRRKNPLVVALTPALGVTPAQLDQMFIEADQITDWT